ncbi:hypothetical protein [Aureimonas sp. OT7]|uniref:hypothetical protein n=1 Tax=Aureimonas sp. OT7 TaxID=2816454 RepID=UPI0019D6320D|nr:hypothetical protein [Aureimonas sp. OT7]
MPRHQFIQPSRACAAAVSPPSCWAATSAGDVATFVSASPGQVDVLQSNGVVHVIDTVLMPAM